MASPSPVRVAVDELTDQLATARSQESVTQAFARFATALDYSWFTYLAVQGGTVRGISNYPQEWQRLYLDHSLNRVDPIVIGAASQPGPFTWSQYFGPIAYDRDQQRFMADARRHGIRSGLSIPLREGLGQRALLTLASPDPRPKEAIDFPAFTALSLGAYLDGIMRGRLTDLLDHGACPLTYAQLQCLTWLLRGKTNEDIAALRGSSRRAVESHLQHVRERLGVGTTYQAIAIAVERRWILP